MHYRFSFYNKIKNNRALTEIKLKHFGKWIRDTRKWSNLDEWCIIRLSDNAVIAQSRNCSAETIAISKNGIML